MVVGGGGGGEGGDMNGDRGSRREKEWGLGWVYVERGVWSWYFLGLGWRGRDEVRCEKVRKVGR